MYPFSGTSVICRAPAKRFVSHSHCCTTPSVPVRSVDRGLSGNVFVLAFFFFSAFCWREIIPAEVEDETTHNGLKALASNYQEFFLVCVCVWGGLGRLTKNQSRHLLQATFGIIQGVFNNPNTDMELLNQSKPANPARLVCFCAFC